MLGRLCSWIAVHVYSSTLWPLIPFHGPQSRKFDPVPRDLTQSRVDQTRCTATRCICSLLGVRQAIQNELFPLVLPVLSVFHMPGNHPPRWAVEAVAWGIEVPVDVLLIAHPYSLGSGLFPHDDVTLANPRVHTADKLVVPPAFFR